MRFEKIKYIILVAFVAALVGCGEDIAPTQPPIDPSTGDAIAFRSVSEDSGFESRALIKEDFVAGDNMGVVSYYFPDGVDDISTLTPNFMYNQRVGYDGSQWSYSPIKYWPNNQGDRLMFFAYHPYNDGENNTNIQITPADHVGRPHMTFNTNSNLNDQQDLLVARSSLLSKDEIMNTHGGVVGFDFKHALSQINFSVELTPESKIAIGDDKFRVRGVALANMWNSGVLEMDVDDNIIWALDEGGNINTKIWSDENPNGELEYLKDYYITGPSSTDNSISIIPEAPNADNTQSKDVIFVLPQPHNSDPKIRVMLAYYLDSDTEEAGRRVIRQVATDIPVPSNGVAAWQPGVRYRYNLIVDHLDGEPTMSAKVTILDWESQEMDVDVDGGSFDLTLGRRDYYVTDSGGTTGNSVVIPFETDYSSIQVTSSPAGGTPIVNMQSGEILFYIFSSSETRYTLTVSMDGGDKTREVELYVHTTEFDYSDKSVVDALVGPMDDGSLRVANSYIIRPSVMSTTYIPIMDKINTYWSDYSSGANPQNIIADESWVDNDDYSVDILWYDGESIDGVQVGKSYTSETNSIYINAPMSIESQNILVAVKYRGVILWSWHFWLTEYWPYNFDAPASPTTNSKLILDGGGEVHRYAGSVWQSSGEYAGKYMMDRDLGAVNTAFDPDYGAGVVRYQYGRKDPFPTNGTRVMTTTKTNTTIERTVHNPTEFNYGESVLITDAPSDIYLWNDKLRRVADGGKSIFDPSPLGWMVPKHTVWSAFTSGNISISRNGQIGMTYTAGGVNAFYPTNGYIGGGDGGWGGNASAVAIEGAYRSVSAYTNNFAYALLVQLGSSVRVEPGITRMGGFSVRAIQE